jgi:beta-lactam-binding protein with PASTA domain
MVMPQLTGMPLAAAEALVVHAGLKLGPVQNSYSDAPPAAGEDAGMAPADTVDPAGTVLGQTPIAGYRVEPGMTITFRVAQ